MEDTDDSDARFWQIHNEAATTLSLLYNEAKLEMTPHIIVAGPSGVGKSTIVNAWLCDFYNVSSLVDAPNMFHVSSKNAPNGNFGIEMVRSFIKPFLKRQSGSQSNCKSLSRVLIDDAQNLTVEAQNALVRMLEIYSPCSRFVIVVQNCDTLVAALKSRCHTIHLQPPSSKMMQDYATWYGAHHPECKLDLPSLLQVASTSPTIGNFLSQVLTKKSGDTNNAPTTNCLNQLVDAVNSFQNLPSSGVVSRAQLLAYAEQKRTILLLCDTCAEFASNDLTILSLLVQLEPLFLKDETIDTEIRQKLTHAVSQHDTWL